MITGSFMFPIAVNDREERWWNEMSRRAEAEYTALKAEDAAHEAWLAADEQRSYLARMNRRFKGAQVVVLYGPYEGERGTVQQVEFARTPQSFNAFREQHERFQRPGILLWIRRFAAESWQEPICVNLNDVKVRD